MKVQRHVIPLALDLMEIFKERKRPLNQAFRALPNLDVINGLVSFDSFARHLRHRKINCRIRKSFTNRLRQRKHPHNIANCGQAYKKYFQDKKNLPKFTGVPPMFGSTILGIFFKHFKTRTREHTSGYFKCKLERHSVASLVPRSTAAAPIGYNGIRNGKLILDA